MRTAIGFSEGQGILIQNRPIRLSTEIPAPTTETLSGVTKENRQLEKMKQPQTRQSACLAKREAGYSPPMAGFSQGVLA